MFHVSSSDGRVGTRAYFVRAQGFHGEAMVERFTNKLRIA